MSGCKHQDSKRRMKSHNFSSGTSEVITMGELCASSSAYSDNADGQNVVKARLKRSPRCMQIDLLPLIATNMTMVRKHRPNRPNTKISPAVWNGEFHIWSRRTLLPSIKPTIHNSKVDCSVEQHLQPLFNDAKEPIFSENTDIDTCQINDLYFLTMSDLQESFFHINIANPPGRAWLSSILDVSNYQKIDMSAPTVLSSARENHPEETSQLPVGVESMGTNRNTWDAVRQQGNDPHRSSSCDHCQECTILTMKVDECEESSKISKDEFVETQVNKPLKRCPAFISPWFDPKTYPLPGFQKSLDGTGDESTEADDRQDFDGIGLRPQSQSDRVRSRQYWNGDDKDRSSRNVRQRVQDHPRQNIIANEFLDNYDGFEPGDNLPRWFPQPGDIIITRHLRRGDNFSPGGHVTLYKDAEFFFFTREAREPRSQYAHFQDGDFVVRLGKFTEDWKWHPNPNIEAFLCDLRQDQPWWLVARTYNSDLQPPEYQFDELRAPVNRLDPTFRPRHGDLVVRAVPGEHRWGLHWWNHDFYFYPCDMVLRIGYEVRANGTCMVVELYYRELNDRDWSFRGRDFWTYLATPGLGPQPMEQYV